MINIKALKNSDVLHDHLKRDSQISKTRIDYFEREGRLFFHVGGHQHNHMITVEDNYYQFRGIRVPIGKEHYLLELITRSLNE